METAPLTQQEIFDKVSVHLLTQMEKATNPGGDCLYKTKNGLMCAFGCLLGPLYKKSMEDCNIYDLLSEYNSIGELLGDERSEDSFHNQPLLEDLQELHDNNYPKDWKILLYDVGIKYNLTLHPSFDIPEVPTTRNSQ